MAPEQTICKSPKAGVLRELPPVRLLAIDDAHFPAPAGAEVELDGFYRDILQFEREPDSYYPVYRAENFRLIFDVLEPPIQREDFRPLRLEVPALAITTQRLSEAEIPYTRQRGLLPGQQSLLLLDPAGNWVEIAQWRLLR